MGTLIKTKKLKIVVNTKVFHHQSFLHVRMWDNFVIHHLRQASSQIALISSWQSVTFGFHNHAKFPVQVKNFESH